MVVRLVLIFLEGNLRPREVLPASVGQLCPTRPAETIGVLKVFWRLREAQTARRRTLGPDMGQQCSRCTKCRSGRLATASETNKKNKQTNIHVYVYKTQ